MSNPKFSWNDKVIVLFTLLFVGLFLFNAGLDAGRHYYFQMSVDLVLATFFAAILGAAFAGKWNEFNSRVEAVRRDEHEKAGKLMGEAIDAIRESIEENRKTEMVEAIIKDVTKGKKPQKAHCAKIAKAIHENLELFAEVSINANGGFDVAYSENPLEMPSAGKKAAPKRKAQPARAKISKPVTKKKAGK